MKSRNKTKQINEKPPPQTKNCDFKLSFSYTKCSSKKDLKATACSFAMEYKRTNYTFLFISHSGRACNKQSIGRHELHQVPLIPKRKLQISKQ